MANADPPPRDVELSLVEWLVLAVVAEKPSHGFGIAKELRSDTPIGQIVAVHRPMVYRALDRLVQKGLAEAHRNEPGDSGPTRTICRLTSHGRLAIDRWLDRPVEHIRDLRIEFLAKVRLNQRIARDIVPLVRAQHSVLADTFERLTTDSSDDVVDLWRRHNARAAEAFLRELAPT